MGLLDFLNGDTGASPWGALYPSPMTDDDAKRKAAAAGVLAQMGVGPEMLPAISPFDRKPPAPDQASPLDNAQWPAGPVGAPASFGGGAMPFGFAGPGSMTGINPGMMAAPAAAAPQQSQAPAATFADRFAPALPLMQQQPGATDVSAVKRPADEDQADPIKVGNYLMPRVGSADLYEPDDSTPANARPTQGQIQAAPAASSPAPFSLGGAGAGIGDRLMKATRGFMGNMALGPVGALMGGAGALISGRETDPTAVATQKSTATAQALLKKGAPLEDVQAAINNPALMTSLLAQYYGKDKFKVVQTGENDGAKSFSVFNETDGTMKPVTASADANEPGGTVAGPDGKPITIPPGVNRKEFIKQVTHATADAATGKKTEAQVKASSFAARMEQAETGMSQLQNEGLSLYGKGMENVPGGVGNYMQSPQYQKYQQKQSAFITALLRQESGAAINKSEFDRYQREMFPQPGDDPAVVQQKATMRAAAIQQMRGAAGPGYKSPAAAAPSGKTSSGISWSVQ